jgi:mannose-1-phosphate guanylyltransferase
LTYSRPKHLLPIANKPHIDHVLDLLQRHGVSEAVLLTSYLAEAFEATIEGARARGFTMHVTHEAEPLGTAGAIKNAEEFAREGTCLVFNGDVLTDVDLGALVERHRRREAIGTIFLTPVDDPSAFGVVPTDDNDRVTGFIEKPPAGEAPTNLINAGIYVLEPAILDRIPKGEVWSSEHQLFPSLVEENAGLHAVALEAYWKDIGTPANLLGANLDALSGAYKTEAVPEPGPRAALISPGAIVDEEAQVISSCIGEGAHVAAGAIVKRSVLLPGATVASGAKVSASILGQSVAVAEDAVLEDETIGDGEHV